MASASTHAVGQSRRGRCIIYVAGFELDHWNLFPEELARQMWHATIDVRVHLPRDPASRGKGKNKGKGKEEISTVDSVTRERGFVDAVAEVVETVLTHQHAICG